MIISRRYLTTAGGQGEKSKFSSLLDQQSDIFPSQVVPEQIILRIWVPILDSIQLKNVG